MLRFPWDLLTSQLCRFADKCGIFINGMRLEKEISKRLNDARLSANCKAATERRLTKQVGLFFWGFFSLSDKSNLYGFHLGSEQTAHISILFGAQFTVMCLVCHCRRRHD